ncbi:ice-binding family protein [Nonomuraea endophytica]|uniref:ice-binding family protein n=1 Tax=Nonomuraea endophytica TaxID=714136 RepID=UPI0037CB0693
MVLLSGLALLASSALFASPAHAYANPSPVNLGAAGNYAILASSGISTTGVTAVTGHLGISPAAATAITGFGLILEPSGTYSTSAQVVGKVYAANYTAPTPTNLTTAVNNEVTAYNDAAGRTPADSLNYLAGAVAGPVTLARGLYKWTTAVTVSGTVTLNGGPNDVFIFQVADTLNFAASANIVLSGGARACNVFWQSASQVTLSGGAQPKGVILSKTAIVAQSGAKLTPGRALAQTSVTMIANTVTAPLC